MLEDSSAPRAENFAEQIERIVETPAASARALERGMPEPVVGRALVRIDEDVVSVGDFLEMLLCLRVVRVAVRVVFHGQLAVSDLDFVRGRAARNPEKFVGVFAMP